MSENKWVRCRLVLKSFLLHNWLLWRFLQSIFTSSSPLSPVSAHRPKTRLFGFQNIYKYFLCSDLDILVCRVFEICTDNFCLVQVDPAGFLNLQVLEDNVVGGKVEVVEEENGLHSDSSGKPPSPFESFLKDRHPHTVATGLWPFANWTKPFVALVGHETAGLTTRSQIQKQTQVL